MPSNSTQTIVFMRIPIKTAFQFHQFNNRHVQPFLITVVKPLPLITSFLTHFLFPTLPAQVVFLINLNVGLGETATSTTNSYTDFLQETFPNLVLPEVLGLARNLARSS